MSSESPLTGQNLRLIAYSLAGARVDGRRVIAARPLRQDDWWNPPGADGKGAVKALRSRIPELERDHGYGFDHRRRGTMREYVLVELPEPAASGATPEAEPPEYRTAELFDLAAELDRAPQHPGFYDVDAA